MAKKRNIKINKLPPPDTELLSLIVIMVLFGLVMVGSASSVNALYRYDDSLFFLRKQIYVAIAGFVFMYIVSRIDYHIIASPIFIFLGGSAVWFLMLLAAFIGDSRNGANRWIDVGGISVQPSEPAKIVLIVLTAYVCSKQSKDALKRFGSGVCLYLGIIAVAAFPLLLERHKSATIIFAILVVTISLIGGANIKYYIALSPRAAAGFIAWALHDDYSKQRVITMFDPFKDAKDTGYQAVQSLDAIGSGGIFGLGLGRSQQKITYIPEPQNDFIFSIICEELGFIGAMCVIALFTFFMFRCIKVASEAPDKLGRLIAMGLTTLIMAQFVINILVVTGLFPVTGMPLPFFSAGGTNLLFTLMSMGLLINISRQSVKKRPL